MGVNGARTFPWTDETREHAARLWGEGDSASEIAGALYTSKGGPSRNAVIGVLHRMGLRRGTEGKEQLHTAKKAIQQRKDRSYKDRSATQRLANIVKVRSPSNGGARVEPVIVREPDPDLEEYNAAIPQEQRCTLMQLTDTTCRFPCGDVGDSDFFFCGAAVPSEDTYCRYHARVAYQPYRPPAPRPYHPLGPTKPAVF